MLARCITLWVCANELGNAFRIAGTLWYERNPPVISGFPSQRASESSFPSRRADEYAAVWNYFRKMIVTERDRNAPNTPEILWTRSCFLFLNNSRLLSGVPDYFDRNKISSGGDLSH